MKKFNNTKSDVRSFRTNDKQDKYVKSVFTLEDRKLIEAFRRNVERGVVSCASR